MRVKLIDWPNNFYSSVYTMQKSTWGKNLEFLDGSPDKEKEAREILLKILKHEIFGGAILESIKFTFAIEGVSRALTHQLVRARIGVGFAQQGLRDNDATINDVVEPPTIAADKDLSMAFHEHYTACKKLYHRLRQKGVPFQDCRFAMPIGTATNIVMTINYTALQGWCSKRLCNCMQWEINELARLLRFAVTEFDVTLGAFLRPPCEFSRKCTAKPTLFAPCGKYEKTHSGIYEHESDMNPNMKHVFPDRVNADLFHFEHMKKDK